MFILGAEVLDIIEIYRIVNFFVNRDFFCKVFFNRKNFYIFFFKRIK